MKIINPINSATRLPSMPRDKRGLGPRALAVLGLSSVYQQTRRFDSRDEWSLSSRPTSSLGNN